MSTVPGPLPDGALPVNSVFGPTWQGEGPHAGRLAAFVRLGGCNLACTWCDTPYTWDATRFDLRAENPSRRAERIAARLITLPEGALVVISGGEPLIHARRPAFARLIRMLAVEQHRPVHIETNGTIAIPDELDALIEHTSVSPKLANNGADPHHRRIKPAALDAFAERARSGHGCFKFVAAMPGDLDEIDDLITQHRIPPYSVWVMPEGSTATATLKTHRTLSEHILDRGYNTTARLHTLLWDDEKDR